MPTTSIRAIRQQIRGMEPEMRATAIALITKYRPDTIIGDPALMSTHHLMELAESCNLPRHIRRAHREEVRKKRAARAHAAMEAARKRLERTVGPPPGQQTDPQANTHPSVFDICDSDEARRKRQRDRRRKDGVLRLVRKPLTSDANVAGSEDC